MVTRLLTQVGKIFDWGWLALLPTQLVITKLIARSCSDWLFRGEALSLSSGPPRFSAHGGGTDTLDVSSSKSHPGPPQEGYDFGP